MRLGYNTNGFAHHRLDDTVSILADLGYQTIALTVDHGVLDVTRPGWRTDAERLKVRLDRLGMSVVIETGARFLLDPRRKHQPTLLDADDEMRDVRLGFLEDCITLGSLLDAEAISFWAGTPTEDGPHLERLTAGCQSLCDFAAERNQLLAFEPEPGMFIDRMDRFAELFERVNHPAFGLALDVGHLCCLNELPVLPHLRRWKHVLRTVHIEDMVPGIHDHRMFGEGTMDFTEIMSGLREIDYRGSVCVELSRHSYDAVRTAQRSMAFLRRF